MFQDKTVLKASRVMMRFFKIMQKNKKIKNKKTKKEKKMLGWAGTVLNPNQLEPRMLFLFL